MTHQPTMPGPTFGSAAHFAEELRHGADDTGDLYPALIGTIEAIAAGPSSDREKVDYIRNAIAGAELARNLGPIAAPQSPADWPSPVAAPVRPRRRLAPILLGALGVMVAAALAVAFAPGLNPVAGPTLVAAAEECGGPSAGLTLADGDKTLLIDTEGTDDAGGTDVMAMGCVAKHLEMPAAVVAHMDGTRALDGRQTDSWGDFTAAWSYHPDDGVSLTIEQR
jgi:hypothetical protein